MTHEARLAVLGACLVASVLTTGCLGGGGGSSGLFDSLFAGGDSGFGSGSGDSGSGSVASVVTSTSTNPGGGGTGITQGAVVGPEPGSMALFGSGLVGATLLRRRRTSKKRAPNA